MVPTSKRIPKSHITDIALPLELSPDSVHLPNISPPCTQANDVNIEVESVLFVPIRPQQIRQVSVKVVSRSHWQPQPILPDEVR